MAVYLKKFETQSAYEAAQSSLILPNVSLTVDNNTVHYNPSSPTPPTPTYETVDLGLPSGTLWAKWNVGATSETEYGNYYQYGKGADDCSVTSGESTYEGEEVPLAISADTAAQEWGDNWHMPTSTQCQELIDNTTYEWTTINGVNGGKFTATNGNYVFFPAAGFFDGFGNWYDVGNGGYYNSSTPDYSSESRYLYFSSELVSDAVAQREEGHSVRAVIG